MRRASTSIVISSPSRERADRPAADRLGRDVRGHEAVRGAGEAPVGDQRDALPQPLALTIAAVTASISRMPGPPAGPSLRITTTSPALDLVREHGRHRGLLAVEHARRADVAAALVAGELDDAAVGRDVAAQDREAAGGLERIATAAARRRWPARLLRLGGVLADRAAGDGDRVARCSTPASAGA